MKAENIKKLCEVLKIEATTNVEKIAEEKLESECGRYYKAFLSQPTKFRPSQIMMHFFYDYTDYLDWIEVKVAVS